MPSTSYTQAEIDAQRALQTLLDGQQSSRLTALETANTALLQRVAALEHIAPPPPPTPTPTPTPVPTPAGQFSVAGGRILGGDGKAFVALGANVGTASNFDWNGTADGHAADARKWGWNCVRLNLVLAPAFAPTATTIGHAQSIIDEYTAAGVVVIVASHDGTDQAAQSAARPALVALAKKYAGNPRVWFNPMNEPPVASVAAWVAFHKQAIADLRAVTSNVIVCDAITDAEDGGWEPGMLKDCASQVTGPNIVFAIHNYGSYTDTPSYVSHLDQLRTAGFAVLSGETGYLEAETGAGANGHTQGALACFGAYAAGYGVLAWHGTHGDGYTLIKGGGPFYAKTDGTGLSDFGAKLWKLSH